MIASRFGSGVFKFEFGRIFRRKTGIILLLFLSLVSIYLVYSGIVEYKEFLAEKESFMEYERNVFKKYVYYRQYSDSGFRLLYEPSELSIFFGQRAAFDNLYTYIDMSEIIKINQSVKGKEIFSKKSLDFDLSSFLLIFGSLIFLVSGLSAYESEKHFFHIGNTFVRLLIINGVIFFLMIILYGLPLFLGVTTINPISYFYFCLYLLLFLDFFYSIGLFVRILKKTKFGYISTASIIWLISIYVVTGMASEFKAKKIDGLPSNESFNSVKMDRLMSFEKGVKEEAKKLKTIEEVRQLYKNRAQVFFNTDFKKNTEMEANIIKEVSKVLETYENLSVIYPTVYYSFFCGEISSKGYNGYLDFSNRIISLRYDFVKFSLQKMYNSEDKVLEPFVKGDENIFKAKSHLPGNYWVGTGITAFYTLILFLASFFVLRRRQTRQKETLDPKEIKHQDGKMYLILCENQQYQELLFNHYEQQEDAVCIDEVKGEDIDPGVSLNHMLEYFSKFKGANLERAYENIEKLGITNLKNEAHTPEAVKKVFCAVHLAGEKTLFVFKDFIKQESRDFEGKFLLLLKEMLENEVSIIYLTTQGVRLNAPFSPDNQSFDKYIGMEISNPGEYKLR